VAQLGLSLEHAAHTDNLLMAMAAATQSSANTTETMIIVDIGSALFLAALCPVGGALYLSRPPPRTLPVLGLTKCICLQALQFSDS
jgi:hypothetical protein